MSWNQINTEWGEPFEDITLCGSLLGKIPILRGYGLRLIDPDTGKLEIPGNPKDPKWAIEYMRRRIKLVWDNCINCKDTDYFIAAALAQNGPGFTHKNMQFVGNLSDDEKIWYPNATYKKDWPLYFENDYKDEVNMVNTRLQLDRFTRVINELKRKGWYVPSGIGNNEWDFIDFLRNKDWR